MPTNAETVASWFQPPFDHWTEDVLEHMYENVWHPDVEWRAIEGAPDDVGVMHGRDRLRRYYGEWLELFDDIRMNLREVIEVGERVVAVLHVMARAKGSGVPTEIDLAEVNELSGDRLVRGREYASREEAVEAAKSPSFAVS